MALFVFPAPSLPPRRTNSPRGCVSRPRPWPSSGHSLASASPPAQVLQEAEGAGGLRGLPGARGHKDHRAGEVAGNGLGPRWAVKAQSLGSDGRTWLEWRFLCFGRGQRVGTTERIDRRTPSETPSSLDLECHVSHMYKPSDTPPPRYAVHISTCWSLCKATGPCPWRRAVCLPQPDHKPARGVHLYSPLVVGPSYYWEPNVSSLAPQKAHLPASRLSGPFRTTAPERLQRSAASQRPASSQVHSVCSRDALGRYFSSMAHFT